MDEYFITLTDKNGITIGGTNKKIADGVPVSLNATGQKISCTNLLDWKPKTNQPITSGTTHNTLIASVQTTGSDNMVITIQGAVEVIPKTKGISYGGTSVRIVDAGLLHLFRMVKNTYYLKDYIGSSTDVLTPISAMIQTNDFFTEYTTPAKILTSDGLPVVVKSVDFGKVYNAGGKSMAEFTIVLVEDKV